MTHRLFQVSLVMLGLTMPWYVIRGQIGPIPVTLLEGVIWVVLGIWLIDCWRRQQWPGWPGQGLGWWALWPGLFLVAATIGLVVSPDLRAALGIYKAYIIEPLLVGWMVSQLDAQDGWWLVAGLIGASLEIAGLGVLQILSGWPNWAPAELAQGRATATFNTGNAIGLFVGPVIGLMVPLVFYCWHRGRRLVAGMIAVAIILDVSVIYLSRSRGAMIGLALLVAVALLLGISRRWSGGWVRHWRWGSVKVWSVALIGVYILATLGFMLFINHPPKVANPYARTGFTTLTVRQCTWQGTMAMLRDHPIVGAGLAGFTTRYLPYVTCDAEPLVYPHNLVLNFWSELGLLGLLSMAGVLVVNLIIGWRLIHSSWMILGWAGILITVYWLTHGVVDVPYFKNDLSLEWWMVTGLLIGANRWRATAS